MKRKAYELSCKECRQSFTATRRDARYCSESCKQRIRWRTVKETDPEKWKARKERMLAYHAANRERAAERFRQRREADPLAHKNWQHNCDDWSAILKELWDAQDGRCYLCTDELDSEDTRRVHADHDHSCCPPTRSCAKCRRGLACNACNVAIGYARDDPDRLRRIADNLEVANALVRQRVKEADWDERGILFDLEKAG